MANNLAIKDGAGSDQTVKTTDTAGVHTPHQNVDAVPADPFGANADAAATAGSTGSISAKLRAISRDLVANVVLAAGSNRIGKVTIRNAANGADIDPLSESDFDTKAGSLTETAPATDTASSGLNGRLQRIAQRLTTLLAVFPTTIDVNSGNKSASTLRVVLATDQPTMTNAQPVTPAATEVHLGQVGGHTATPTGTMTRPSDTTAYAAGDGVTTATSSASAMSVTNAARVSAGGGIIFGGKLTKSTTSTTNASFRGWIYQDTPSAIPNDNAAFSAAVHADYTKLVGTFTVDFSITGITGSDGVTSPITLSRANMAYKLASGTSLIVILEARAAYTPGSAEVFRLWLDASQD